MPEHCNSMQDTQMHLWHNYSNLLSKTNAYEPLVVNVYFTYLNLSLAEMTGNPKDETLWKLETFCKKRSKMMMSRGKILANLARDNYYKRTTV